MEMNEMLHENELLKRDLELSKKDLEIEKQNNIIDKLNATIKSLREENRALKSRLNPKKKVAKSSIIDVFNNAKSDNEDDGEAKSLIDFDS